MKPVLASVIALLALVALAGCAPSIPPIKAAVKSCGLTHSDFATLGDKGTTLTLDGSGEESDGLPFTKEQCVFKKLHITDAVTEEMGQTRALDGRQTGSWKGFKASWTYHPDDGLDIVITQRQG